MHGDSTLRPSNRTWYVVMAALLALSIGLQMVRDRGWAPYVPPDPLLWVNAGPQAAKLALGFDNIVADVYWMRAVIYYGGKRRDAAAQQGTAPVSYELLYPLLDMVTSLDPHFRLAYRFGAIFLTEGFPDGPGRPDQAIQLLQRGLERDAMRWEYMQDIGFVHYWALKDYPAAAHWFRRAAQLPGAPQWLEPLAATTLAVGGDRQSSRVLWQQLHNGSDLEWIRSSAEYRLQQLDAMDAIDALNKRIQAFEARQQRRPTDWREIGLRSAPVDPAGTPYRINPSTGLIDLGPGSALHPLPK